MTSKKLIAALSLCALLLIAALVLLPFASALAWAAIAAFATWPLRNWLMARVPVADLAALLLTLFAIMGVLLPVAMLSAALQREVQQAVDALGSGSLSEHLLTALRAAPWIGDELGRWAVAVLHSPAEIARQAGQWTRDHVGSLFTLAGGLGHNALSLGITFLALHFMYRDADEWLAKLRLGLVQLFGRGGLEYLATVCAATRMAVYGLLLTALAQATVAGIGFWFTGVPAPTLLALATALFALVPFGTFVTVGIAVAWLAMSGAMHAAVGLALWGLIAVGLIDNLLRPLVTSRGLSLHYLWATVGVVGGVSLFGLIGVFAGPIVLAVLGSLLEKWLGGRGPEAENAAAADEAPREAAPARRQCALTARPKPGVVAGRDRGLAPRGPAQS